MTRRRRSNEGEAPKKGSGTPRSALGDVGEDRVFELLTVLGKGEFVCYSPRSDIEGTDLLVKRRYGPAVLGIQVKTRGYEDKYGNFTLAIDEEDVPEADPKAIVVIDYVPGRAQLGRFCWVIPSPVFRERSTLTGHKYESNFRRKATSVDKWVDYRYVPEDLPWVIGWYLDGRGAAPSARWMPPPRHPKTGRIAATRGRRPRPAPRRASPRRASRPRSRRR